MPRTHQGTRRSLKNDEYRQKNCREDCGSGNRWRRPPSVAARARTCRAGRALHDRPGGVDAFDQRFERFLLRWRQGFVIAACRRCDIASGILMIDPLLREFRGKHVHDPCVGGNCNCSLARLMPYRCVASFRATQRELFTLRTSFCRAPKGPAWMRRRVRACLILPTSRVTFMLTTCYCTAKVVSKWRHQGRAQPPDDTHALAPTGQAPLASLNMAGSRWWRWSSL